MWVSNDGTHEKGRGTAGSERSPPSHMVLLYLSIPIMVVAVAIATLPLLATMRREERARREALGMAGLTGPTVPSAIGGSRVDAGAREAA